ncbi:hypothetical protein JRI60_42650 [Archangium violaceum]|uniref:hypothetical protein n=1 Tax=Archangium violaceum TaxID=83451 RepID=UPI00195038B6|nr:hypothetical protein [Archangium violaceum]QRN95687.1 hypothetical protein JRI60_42650 [Archangium violaceum]
MRKPIWSGLVLCTLLGCAGTSTSTSGDTSRPAPQAEAPADAPVEAPPGEQQSPAAVSSTPKTLRLTDSPSPKDDIIIQSLELQGDTLVAKVMHSGGCKEHTYDLLWKGDFQKTAAGGSQAELVLAHDANGDACEALLNRTASFDLGPLKQRWREQYKSEHGTIELRFTGAQATARYEF